jgi:multidrug efflux pump subunit AcrA (membrane-fusion protein)
MVKVELDNPEKLLKPGMVCNATIENPVLANRLVVPVAAVQSKANGQKYVYVAAQGKALRKDVETGTLVSNGIVIKTAWPTATC